MRITILASIVLAGAMAVPATGAPAPTTSWGKAGVSLNQYWRDSVECAATATLLDVSKTEPARNLVKASRELDEIADTMWMEFAALGSTIDGNPGLAYQRAYNKYRPDEQVAAVRQMMVSTLEKCLVDRGYSRFRLTDEQARQLRHLRRGTDARRAYLHSLGSDPALIEAQRI